MAVIGAYFLPILVLFMVLLAVVEGLLNWVSGRGLVPWLRNRTGRSLSRAVYADFGRHYQMARQIELDQQAAEDMLRDDGQDGAPPRGSVDLDNGLVYISLRRGQPPGRSGSPGPAGPPGP
jgi:hypothetical protein